MRFFKIVGKCIKWTLIFFFTSTILAVILYRFIPVYYTPLMVIRSVEQLVDGKSVTCHHKWVSLDKISTHLPNAVMASEDQRFLEHSGFDWKAIKEAHEENQRNKELGKTKFRGASTISQQTAKNVFLWPGRSWVRKGLEAYFTFLIELFWSKERIMEVYLNSIEMGDGIYGAEAVANHHFKKSAALLTKSECAIIASTLPDPRHRNSGDPSYRKRWDKRRRNIEKQMNLIRPFPIKKE